MDTYSNLVSRILKITALAGAAKEIAAIESDPKHISLNLVTPDWDTVLQNHEEFKQCHFRSERKPISTNSYYEYEISKDTLFNVTLAANCRFVKKEETNAKQKSCIIINNSEPLAKIASVMTIDKGSHIPISDNHKFSFKDCSFLTCNLCTKSLDNFVKKGYIIKSCSQPCIAVTKVFDGQNIYNRFYNQLEESFKNETFIAILHLKINVRYMFSDKNYGGQKMYRIGGFVTNMLAFNEAKLDLMRTINLGDITAINSTEEAQEPTNGVEEQDIQLKNVYDDIMNDINDLQNDSLHENDSLLDEPAFKKFRVTEDIFSIDQ